MGKDRNWEMGLLWGHLVECHDEIDALVFKYVVRISRESREALMDASDMGTVLDFS